MIDTTTQTKVWTIDPVHSFVEFSIKHMKIATVKGRFTDVHGQITTDNDNIEHSTVEVVIGAASIDNHNQNRDIHLKSADFFDVATFPTLMFRSRHIAQSGDDLLITGDLTIHGVTQQVLLAVSYNGQAINPTGQPVISYSAETMLNRKDFGLNWNSAIEAGGVLVGEEVKVSIEIEAYA